MAVLIVTRLEKVALLTFAEAVLTDDLSVAEVSRSVVCFQLNSIINSSLFYSPPFNIFFFRKKKKYVSYNCQRGDRAGKCSFGKIRIFHLGSV